MDRWTEGRTGVDSVDSVSTLWTVERTVIENKEKKPHKDVEIEEAAHGHRGHGQEHWGHGHGWGHGQRHGWGHEWGHVWRLEWGVEERSSRGIEVGKVA